MVEALPKRDRQLFTAQLRCLPNSAGKGGETGRKGGVRGREGEGLPPVPGLASAQQTLGSPGLLVSLTLPANRNICCERKAGPTEQMFLIPKATVLIFHYLGLIKRLII